ncbi:MAG: GHKL domain-containing protein [Candidatus Wallbacteria bacterium]|nr:GHKL domain-containing protein [Candidatus Wallbacteria bacterium]
MDRLIEDLLNLSKLNQAPLARVAVDLAGLARDVVTGLPRLRPERLVTIDIAEVPPAVGDESLLRAVMHNLLDNAWKFTSKRPAARIEFGSEQRDGETVYFVRDNGAGFSMASATRLFGPFQRLHSPSEFEGHGIGLATVQRIVTRHGGRIWAEAEMGRGATFYFTLP